LSNKAPQAKHRKDQPEASWDFRIKMGPKRNTRIWEGKGGLRWRSSRKRESVFGGEGGETAWAIKFGPMRGC